MSIDLRKAHVSSAKLDFGFEVHMLMHPAESMPLGFVWGRGNGESNNGKSAFEVFGSYTIPSARRCGVRTYLNKHLLKEYHAVYTAHGSHTGGQQFMVKQGYTLCDRTGLWSITRREAGG